MIQHNNYNDYTLEENLKEIVSKNLNVLLPMQIVFGQ